MLNKKNKNNSGIVYIISAGPGNPNLLTLESLRLLQKADVILYDRLVSKEVIMRSKKSSKKIYVGKKPGNHSMSQEQINALIIKYANQGHAVARLKGGDATIFAQCSDEIETLKKEGIPFHISPGVTAATAAAAYAKIPLTCRKVASHCTFITGHNKLGQLPWQDFIFENQTLVFYMGMTNRELIAKNLIASGLPKDTPTAIIEKVGYASQKILITVISELLNGIKMKEINSPAIIIIGDVVSYANGSGASIV